MTDTVFKLKQGEQTYDDFFNALTVAEARAAEKGGSVIVSRKLLNRFEDVAKVYPDGRRELLGDFDPEA